MDCWTWFGALLFGQLTGHDSIRAIERVFASSDSKMYRLGFGPVRRSTLADANQCRPLELLQDIFKYLLTRIQNFAPRSHGFPFQGQILALDSTTIELSLKLCPWAEFYSQRAAAKLHTAIDIASDIPQFAVVDIARTQDLPTVRSQGRFSRGATLLFDRGYLSYSWMEDLSRQGIYFVTRARDCYRFKVRQSRPTNRTQGYICDQLISPKGEKGANFKGLLRRIVFKDPDTGKRLVFLSNRFDLDTKTICDLYKARWKVELFFKTLKQNLKIKKFLGISAHAVKAQIWVALIAYLLVQLIRFQIKSSISIPDAMAVLGTLVLLKEPLIRILGKLPLVTRHPPPFQLVLNL
jgi:putative transposase